MSDELQAFVVAEARLLDERRFSIGSRFAADGAYWAPTPARAALARGGALALLRDARAAGGARRAARAARRARASAARAHAAPRERDRGRARRRGLRS